MGISKQDQKLILVLLGLFIFLAAYFGICKTYNAKKSDVESQISALTTQVEELRGYSADQSTYQSGIDSINTKITDELSKYPGDVRSEDLIMFATELEEKIGIKIDSISIAAPESVATFSILKASGSSYQSVPVAALRTEMTVSCNLSYEQLKKLIDYIYTNSKKSDVSNVSVSFNPETGGLMSTISIHRYFIASADYTYTETDIPSVSQGTDNPFGTFSIVTTSPTPSTTPNEANQN